MFPRWVEAIRWHGRCVSRQRLLAVLVLLAALVLAGCTHTTKPAGGAFLTDYAQLRKSTDAQGHVYFVHRTTMQAQRKHAMYAVTVVYFPAGVRFNGVGAETQAGILAYLDHAIRQRLQQGSLLASTDDQADIRLCVAITSVVAVDPDMKPWDFLPIRLLTRPLKDEVLGAPRVASARLELQMLDARTGAVLSESVREAKGKSIGRQKKGVSVVTVESLRAVLDQWATSVASALASNKS